MILAIIYVLAMGALVPVLLINNPLLGLLVGLVIGSASMLMTSKVANNFLELIGGYLLLSIVGIGCPLIVVYWVTVIL